MSCLTKTCCDKKLDTTHLRKEAASFAESVVDQAERAALWAAPHVSRAAEEVARAAKDAQERLEPVVQEAEAEGVGFAPLQGALAPEEQVGQVVVAGQRSSLLPALPLPTAPHSWRGTDLSHRWDLLLTTSPRRLGQ